MTSAMPLPGLLTRLTAEPGRPRLTWYGGGERVELSGHVLDNWVTKTANLLVEEYDAGPTGRVLLDLPVHWRTVVWAMAVWRVGACVVLPPATPGSPAGIADPVTPVPSPAGGPVDLVVTDRPAGHPGVDVVAVALPALARAFDGELPVGAVDATAAVMTYGDVLTWIPEAEPGEPALDSAGAVVSHEGLVRWANEVLAGRGGARPGGRVLVETGDGAEGSDDAGHRGLLADALGVVLAVYGTDGSVVLCDADAPDRDRLAATELVTDEVRLTG